MAADDTLRREAESALARLRSSGGDDALAAGRAAVAALRKARDFETMTLVAEAVLRQAPRDAMTATRYAQGLIETGKATAAIAVLRPLAQRLVRDDPAWAESAGLLGRAHKQIFFDAGDKTSPAAREALKRAVEAYRLPYEENDAANTWHGVNLIAVLAAARRIGLRIAPQLEPAALARTVLRHLERTPEGERDAWYHATVAEAGLALGDWDAVERHLRAYVTAEGVSAFHLGSTLRQFTEVWNLDAHEARGRPLVAILRARMMQMPGGGLDLTPQAVRALGSAPEPGRGQLEAVLGDDGPKTYRWMLTGLSRARSVAAVYVKLGNRHGTGFLVRARDLGLSHPDERVLLTNHHVVNAEGSGQALRPEAAEVLFEAAEGANRFGVTELLWSSPPDRHDASILRLSAQPAGIEPLDGAGNLPVLDEPQRVYVIGYPGGRELAFSFQDNELLDHEGPPAGKPPIEGVVRLHYRAPTEGGSSGSPVFNEMWDVVGLHHMGGKLGVSRLNGKPGTYAANEGVWIRSVATAPKA